MDLLTPRGNAGFSSSRERDDANSSSWDDEKTRLFNDHKHRQRGVTIIDAILALLILSIGILGTIKFSTIAKQANIASMQRAEATSLATQTIESFRSYSTIPTTVGATAYDDITTGSDTVNGINATYTRAWAVTDNTTYNTVAVTVSWVTADNSNQSINMVTSIGQVEPSLSGELFYGSGGILMPSGS